MCRNISLGNSEITACKQTENKQKQHIAKKMATCLVKSFRPGAKLQLNNQE